MSVKITEFTAEVPVWRPYIAPIRLDTASPQQRTALQETPSNTKVSDYVLVLAHDPQSLAARTPLFNAIMYNRGGLSRAERELGALAASIVNRCIYCAAVHADRYNKLTKDTATTASLFEAGETADLRPRDTAIVRFATRLSKAPAEASASDLEELYQAGLSELEALDLVLAGSLFAWANRLMHTLGEPVAAG